MFGLPEVVTFRTAQLNEDAARMLSRAYNKSELIKFALERLAREKEKMRGGGEYGQAAREQ